MAGGFLSQIREGTVAMFSTRLRNARWHLDRHLRLREEARATHAPVRPATRPHGLPGELVVSVTSYPPRYPMLLPTLKKLLSQSVRADHVILWLAPDDIDALPAEVRLLASEGLQIRTVDDLGPHKKYFGARQAFPNAYIVTMDDDAAYPRHAVADLVRAHRPGEKAVVARRARRVTISSASARSGPTLAPYCDWPIVHGGGELGDDLLPTGVGGVLYPPGAIREEALDPATIRRLCLFGDDFWLFWMVRRAGFTTRMTRRRTADREWHGAFELSLWRRNQKVNDEVWLRLSREFGFPARRP